MLLRLNPFLPFGVLNYVFAMKGVDMGLFVAAMTAVMQWYLLLTCVGAGLSNMYNGYSFFGYAIGAVCGAIVMMVVASRVITFTSSWARFQVRRRGQ